MTAQTDINLIPQEELTKRKKARAVKGSTVVAILILLIVLGATGFLYYTNYNTQSEINALDVEIESLRNKIKAKSQVEISARNLDKKFSSLKTLMEERENFSKLLEEMRARKPVNLSIDSMDVRETKINLSGRADNYVSIANFANNLLNQEFLEGNTELSGLFTSVSLNSVTLERSDNRVKYLIIVDFNPEILKDK